MTKTNITYLFLLFIFTKFFIETWLLLRNKRHIANNRNCVPDMFNKIISILFTIFGFISHLISLPEAIHSTFIIEERFGFNKTTIKTFITDSIKELVLGILISIPILFCILFLMDNLEKNWWIFGATAVTLFQFFIMLIYPVFIAPLFNKFSPLTDDTLKKKINDLLTNTNFPGKKIYVMDGSKRSSHGNAYFTGIGKNKRIVFFDTLINTLTHEEIIAVLAHEIGHYKHRHIIKNVLTSIIITLISFYILGLVYDSQLFFQGHGVLNKSNSMAVLLFFLTLNVYSFFIHPIINILSRKYEFEADTFVTAYAKGEGLATALIKMYKDNASTLTPDPLYSTYFHSHPPAKARIDKILEG